MNLFNIAENSLSKVGDRTLLHFGHDEWTHSHLLSEAENLARLLLYHGLRPGDHVAILLPNGPEIFLAFLSLARLGCVAVPLSIKYTETELVKILIDSETKWVLGLKETVSKVKACGIFDSEKIVDVQAMRSLEKQGAPLPEEGGASEDLAYILYTSGTSGKPKGVMLTHGNIVAEGEGVADAFTLPAEDPSELSQLLVLPLSHSYGLMVMGMTYFMGNKTIVLPRYSTEPVLEAIRNNQIRLMWAVPTMYALMLAHKKAPEYLKSVVHWDSGGAPLPLANLKAIEDRFGGTVTDGYGCTEASGCVTTQTRKRYSPPGTQGFLIKGTQMEVVNDEGQPVPDGEPGEFLISGKTLMKGYWKQKSQTEKKLQNGAYLSGDLGLRHKDGSFTFLERKDDLIIRGGENVYPREVENLLYQMDDVIEAAVKGIHDPIMGQEIKAFVSLSRRSKLDEKKIVDFLSQRLSNYKVPRFIEILPELPKNSNGKILRRKLL